MMAVRWWSAVALILGLLLAACAPAGPAGPQRITLKM